MFSGCTLLHGADGSTGGDQFTLKQRWGSMSPGSRPMLNRPLIEAPVDAIDYVITHELCQVTEPHHGAAFYDLLERVMPDRERRKLRLERVMA